MSIDADNCDKPKVYSERIVKARKEHACDACSEPIRVGDLYSYTFGVWCGAADVIKRCARCDLLVEYLRSLASCDDDVDLRLDCGHSYEDIHAEPPPDWVAALAFATPDDAQKAEALAILEDFLVEISSRG